ILPLVKRGIPASVVHMENLDTDYGLQHVRVLVMSYANMKPLSPAVHEQLADWVQNGGVLLYYGKDEDPFQQVQEWWNTGANTYQTASGHLFELLGVSPESEGLDRKSTRLNSSHVKISYAVFCLQNKNIRHTFHDNCHHLL